MMKSTLSLFLFLFLILNTEAKFIEKGVDFKIVPDKLGNDIHFNVEFLKRNYPNIVNTFDVENLSSKDNTLIIFFKSALILNKDIKDLDLEQFKNGQVHASLLDARILNPIQGEENSWRMSTNIAVKKVEFDYQAFLTEDLTENELINSYIEASENLDRNMPQTKHFLVQYLDRYNTGVQKQIVVSKIIPYKGKTLVVSYQIARLNRKWFEKFNLFNIAENVFQSKLKNTISKTKSYLQ